METIAQGIKDAIGAAAQQAIPPFCRLLSYQFHWLEPLVSPTQYRWLREPLSRHSAGNSAGNHRTYRSKSSRFGSCDSGCHTRGYSAWNSAGCYSSYRGNSSIPLAGPAAIPLGYRLLQPVFRNSPGSSYINPAGYYSSYPARNSVGYYSSCSAQKSAGCNRSSRANPDAPATAFPAATSGALRSIPAATSASIVQLYRLQTELFNWL